MTVVANELHPYPFNRRGDEKPTATDDSLVLVPA